MQLNTANLDTLRVGFKTTFQNALKSTTSMYTKVASVVPSSTKSNKFGWIGKMPNLIEWIGPRQVNGISEHSYTIENKSFELTIGVDRDDIQDDNIGVYTPLFSEMGESAGAHPDMLVFAALKNGFTEICYDGQNFFDTDHPVIDKDGNEVSVANTDGGSGEGWYLLAVNRALKPIIFQERKKPEFVARDKVTDGNVFDLKEFRYGIDSRCNVGYGFWQMAWGSKQALSKTTYKLARESLMAMKGDNGRPLGFNKFILVVSPTNEGAALELLNAERDAAGATNVYKDTAELVVSPWLA